MNDRVKDVEELVLQVELRAVDAEVEARGEGRFDGLETVDVGLAARDDDLEEFGDDGVNVVVERSERRDELWCWLRSKEPAGRHSVTDGCRCAGARYEPDED